MSEPIEFTIPCYKLTEFEDVKNFMRLDGSKKTFIEKSAYDSAITMRDEYLSRLQEKCDDVLALTEEKKSLAAELKQANVEHSALHVKLLRLEWEERNVIKLQAELTALRAERDEYVTAIDVATVNLKALKAENERLRADLDNAIAALKRIHDLGEE